MLPYVLSQLLLKIATSITINAFRKMVLRISKKIIVIFLKEWFFNSIKMLRFGKTVETKKKKRVLWCKKKKKIKKKKM